MYEIKKAPEDLLNKSRGYARKIPIEKMNVGDMIELPFSISNRYKFYNAIKHRRNYTKECEGWEFKVSKTNETTIACIRLK
jgi:hypothetical protein